MAKTAVVYWSGTGNTQKMAEEIAKAANAELFSAEDFNLVKFNEFDAVAFGCPSMGNEELEDGDFAPMFDEIRPHLSNRKISLFGSYGWGDGEWMRTWEKECLDLGAKLICDCLIINEEPDDDGLKECTKFGEALKNA